MICLSEGKQVQHAVDRWKVSIVDGPKEELRSIAELAVESKPSGYEFADVIDRIGWEQSTPLVRRPG